LSARAERLIGDPGGAFGILFGAATGVLSRLPFILS
jgi:hypothetical protein